LLLLEADVRLDNVVDVVVDGVVLELVFGGGLVFPDAMILDESSCVYFLAY
jgi:hypothetical protein